MACLVRSMSSLSSDWSDWSSAEEGSASRAISTWDSLAGGKQGRYHGQLLSPDLQPGKQRSVGSVLVLVLLEFLLVHVVDL